MALYGAYAADVNLDSSAVKDAVEPVVDCSTTWDGSEFQSPTVQTAKENLGTFVRCQIDVICKYYVTGAFGFWMLGNFFTVRIIVVWNSLPISLINCETIAAFKKRSVSRAGNRHPRRGVSNAGTLQYYSTYSVLYRVIGRLGLSNKG